MHGRKAPPRIGTAVPEVALIVFAGAVLLVIMAGVVYVNSRNADLKRRMADRFARLTANSPDASRGSGAPGLLAPLQDQLWRAGLTPRPWHLWGAIAILLLASAIGWQWKGIFGLLSIPLVLIMGCYVVLRWRHQQRAALTLRQLPTFLDQMMRALSAGRTIDNSFVLSTERSVAPLKEVLERVCANTRLGVELSAALSTVARLHGLRELQLLSLAVHVNTRYGGSIRDLLGSLINMIRQREQAQNELRALTGETRVSAWVLGLLPLSLAAYMIAVNPGYLETMWADSTGKTVLASALGMQAVGVLLLWRMIRSI